MITSQRTMPESDFASEDSFDQATDELLDASELQTVLDMLAVMETADELTQLQALTETQKRQVWEATPDALKQRLWRLRTATPTEPSAVQPIVDDDLPSGNDAPEEFASDDELEDEIEDLGQDLDLAANSYASAPVNPTAAPSSLSAAPHYQTEQFYTDRSTPRVGDRVILKAHPKLTPGELKAIWQLEHIQGSEGEVSNASLGTRTYPLSWMVVYPSAEASEYQKENQEAQWTDSFDQDFDQDEEDEEAF